MHGAPSAKAVATLFKAGVKERFNGQTDGTLHDTIGDAENPQRAPGAISLRDRDAFDGLWVIPLLHERVLQRLQVGKQPRLKLHHGDAINTGLVSASAYVPPRLSEGVIGIDLLIETRVCESQHYSILLQQRLRSRTAYAAPAVQGPSMRYGALRRVPGAAWPGATR